MVLIEQLQKIQESRSQINQDYPVIEVVFLVIVAMICGQKQWTDIEDFGKGKENLNWLRQYLPYKNGIPTRHTIARIMRTVIPETLLSAMVGWVNIRRERNGAPIISVDGKVIKGAKASRHDDPLFLVSAFEVEQGLVLTHRPCKGKGMEIQAVREMIDTLDITGCLLTADALHCQVETLKEVKDKGGDMLVQVKSNQPKLLSEVDEQFQAYWSQPEEQQVFFETKDKGHGRTEVRTVFSLPAAFSKEINTKWPMIKGIVAVVRERSINGSDTGSYETSYYVCTDELPLELAAQASRQHWHIENQQHWALDVIFREDAQKMYAGHSPLNMACCRRLVQNLFRKSPGKESVPRKMNKAAWEGEYRSALLFT